MNTSEFENRDSEFGVFDLVASFRFKSATSISFELGRYSDTLYPSDHAPIFVGAGLVFNPVGLIDVHHPCDGHIKTQLRIILPREYHLIERMQELVATFFHQLAIPADETFEAHFVSPEKQSRLENATDRNGVTDRLS